MYRLLFIAVFAALSACDVIKDEAGYPGGYIERKADEHLFEARAQRQRADRYLMSLVLIAPLASDLSQGAAEAKAAAVLIEASYAHLAAMYEAAGTCLAENCGLTEPGNSAFAFENHSYEMQRGIYALTKQTLAQVDLDGLAKNIVELNVIKVLRSFRKVFPIARRVLATYRDTAVTFGDAVLKECRGHPVPKTVLSKKCKTLYDQILEMKTGKHAQALFDVEASGRNISAILSSIDRATARGEAGATWSLDIGHIRGLVYHIDLACGRLRSRQYEEIEGDDANTTDYSGVVNCGTGTKIGTEPIPAGKKRMKFLGKAEAARPIATTNLNAVAPTNPPETAGATDT